MAVPIVSGSEVNTPASTVPLDSRAFREAALAPGRLAEAIGQNVGGFFQDVSQQIQDVRNSRQVFEADHTLYFVPVMPLFRLLRMQGQKSCAELLLSAFGYLYHTVRIPYYRDPSSYMHYHYECNKEWLLECRSDFEGDEYEENMHDVWKNEYVLL